MDEVVLGSTSDDPSPAYMEGYEPSIDHGPHLSAKLSAILFASPRPVSVEAMANACKVSEIEVEDALAELVTHLTGPDLGFSPIEVNGAWQMRSKPEFRGVISQILKPKGKRLTRAASETLAIVAYKQPVGKAEIEGLRGVDALPTLKTLLDLKLIRAIGREDTPGQPLLYGTTPVFLEKFGLKDLSGLPSLRELEELNQESGEASEDLVLSDGASQEPPVLDDVD